MISPFLQRDLAPKVKEKAQQKLAQLQQQLVSSKTSELERLYAARYHKVCAALSSAVLRSEACLNSTGCLQVRFFERVKLERKLKQLERSVGAASSQDDRDALARTQADLQVSRHGS